MYEFESLHDLFLAFGDFISFVYLNYLPFFVCLGLIETILVICLHAMAGHGLRLDWCFRSNLWLNESDKTFVRDMQGFRRSLKYYWSGRK